MKRCIVQGTWLVAGLTLGSLQAAVIVNGSFEDGLNGWTVAENGGSVSVVSQYAGNPFTYNPKAGGHLLAIAAGTKAYAQQSVHLGAGTEVTGWAGFDKDTTGWDMVQVLVSKNGGASFNQIQYWDSYAFSSADWTHWNYTATTTGDYVFRFESWEYGGAGKAVGVFDGFTVVPEPQSGALVVATLLLGGFFIQRRFVKTRA